MPPFREGGVVLDLKKKPNPMKRFLVARMDPVFPQAQIFRLLFLSIFCLVFTFTYKYIAMAASYKSNKVMGLSATFTFIASNIAMPPVYTPSPA